MSATHQNVSNIDRLRALGLASVLAFGAAVCLGTLLRRTLRARVAGALLVVAFAHGGRLETCLVFAGNLDDLVSGPRCG